MSKKIITGVKPTGSSMHLGNLMGAILPMRTIAEKHDSAIFIADLHALTSVKNGKTLRDQSFELAVEYFSIFGIDTPVQIFRQSDIHDITRLMWILSNVTPYSLMLRAHSFKDFEQKIEDATKLLNHYDGQINFYESIKSEIVNVNSNTPIQTLLMKALFERENTINELYSLKHNSENNLNMGVFNYPILMAADILGYDIDAVPVGKDQIQHLEMTRDIARAWNKTYGREVFIEPEAIVTTGLETLPGIDGRKMSKSYDNFIGVFDDEKTMKKRVMSIVTDSLGVDDVKNPDTCNVFALYQVFATPEQTAALRQKYLTAGAGFGYGHAKTELLTVLTEYLRPYREAREKLLKNPELVEARLTEGARAMNARLEAKMQVVREVVGVN